MGKNLTWYVTVAVSAKGIRHDTSSAWLNIGTGKQLLDFFYKIQFVDIFARSVLTLKNIGHTCRSRANCGTSNVSFYY